MTVNHQCCAGVVRQSSSVVPQQARNWAHCRPGHQCSGCGFHLWDDAWHEGRQCEDYFYNKSMGEQELLERMVAFDSDQGRNCVSFAVDAVRPSVIWSVPGSSALA